MAKEELVPQTTEAGGFNLLNNNYNFTNHETIVNGRPEIRLGIVEKDSRELARLFTQQSAISHLSGVTPYRLSEEERLHIDSTYPNLPIIAATQRDVARYYNKNKGSQILVMAVNPNNREKIVGSITVQIGNPGVLAGNSARLVVDEEYRGKRIASQLVKTANAIIFDQLGFNQANASIILGVVGDDAPQKVYRRENYVRLREEQNRCVSWDPDLKVFVPRNVLPVVLEREDYYRYTTSDERVRYMLPLS